ncbi:carbohydrate-binding protein [Pseudoflavitalea sp. X16]|uniref:InlB B-repeat-containing protein n=1 Tax=Paraflavitalea devenefica TaxID=2716334 RepID=UPI00141FEFC8|nr:carbohydrate-binding protein [Paraflavitalea devenefica]NII25985.1 carbohydrate-binding protein [Paraflavitalea devenefica]
MKKNLCLLSCLLFAVMASFARQTLYVSPSGSASNSGTSISAPTTLQNAIATIAAGGTIYMRGGTYNITSTIVIAESNSGTSGATKKIFAYNGEVPVISFAGMAISTSNRGIVLDGSYWHFRGIIIESAGDNGLLLSGDNNTIESCIFRRNADSGLQLSRYNTSYNSISQWPSNNLILNCEAYDNKDPDNEDADGFAAKLTSGNGNVFRNCVSHHNIDDGWDLYTKSDTGPIGAVTLEGCIAHSNGVLTDGSSSGNGDKNGFKLGGEDISVNHIVRRCIAFNNGKHGFTYNRNLGTIEVTNNTGYNNTERNFNFDGGTSVFKNNLSYLSGSNDRIIGTATAPNAFQGASGSFTVTAADFVSLSPGANASPVSSGFLNLANGSDLINSGVTSTGITYNGAAPDLGAIESGATTTTYTLTTSASPAAGGSVTRSPNATTYNSGTVVTLTAAAASGYTFTGWSGDATGTSTSVTVTMNSNKTVTANFTNSTGGTYTLTTTANPAAGGTIARSPNTSSYAAGTVVTLTATPASGYSFSNWSGGASGTSTTTTVTMNANTSVTANFSTNSGGTTLRINDKSGTGTGYCSADGSRQNTYTGADGGYYVNLSNSSGKGITWAVRAGAAGTYTLRWRYANAGSASATSARVLVNGVQVIASVAFPKTTTWSTWVNTADVTITLVAGTNKIRLETTVAAEFANIDWIEIVGNNPTEALCSGAVGSKLMVANEAPENALLAAADACAPVGWATQNGGTTGGGNATPVTVSTLANLTSQANGSGSRVIYVSGTLGAGVGTRVRVAANTTIIGLPGATLYGGFDVRGNNVIIRNMIVRGPGAVDVDGVDCINIDGSGTTNVWIDHCDIYDGQDGNLDITNGASYISVTWTKFHYTGASSNHQFCNLIGNSDSKTSDRGRLKVTMMYNWWTTGCVERMPRVRFGEVHVVNNLFDSPQADYCVRAGIEANLLVESNYFDGVNQPIDFFENDFTAITARNNVFNNTTGNTAGSGTSFTPPYSLTIAPAAEVKAAVTASCGAGATLPSPTTCGCGTNPTTYTLTTTANPSAGGSITRSPNATTYNAGTVVTLTAVPASGYTFVNWSGGASGTSTTTTVTMNANTSVTANFTNSTGGTYTLTTTANPAAGGTITRSPNASSYTAGTVVTLTATPASGYSFSNWSGGASGTSTTTTVTMNANTSVTANFGTSSGGTTLRINDKSGTGTGYCSADGSRQNTYTGADGGYYVNLSNSSGKGITWAVRAGAAGTYTLRWRYANAGSASATVARVLVNGAQVIASVAFPKTTTWSTWVNTADVTVSLVAGTNKIRLETTVAAEFANIDWIEIVGNNPTEALCSGGVGSRVASQGATIPLVDEAPVVLPNPSRGQSSLKLTLATQQQIRVNIYATDGRMVQQLVNRLFAAGVHYLPISYKGLKAGVYFISVNNGTKSDVVQNLVIQ